MKRNPTRATPASDSRRRNTTARNGLYALIDQCVVSGTRFLITILIAKACGEVVLGVYALALSMMLMSLMVQQTLVTTPYANFRKRVDQEHLYFGDTWRMSCWVSVVAGILIAVAGVLFWFLSPTPPLNPDAFPMDQLARSSWAAALAVPFMLATEFFRRTWLIRMKSYAAMVLDSAISAALISILAVLYFMEQLNAVSVFLVMTGVYFSAAVAAFRLLKPPISNSTGEFRANVRNHWEFGKWIFSSEAMTFGRGHLLKWVIGGFLGAGATGIYSACDSLMRAINPFFLAVANVTEPTLASGYAKSGRKEVRRIALKVLGIMFLGTLPICLLVSLLSEPLLLHLYGPAFAKFQWVVIWLALAALIYSNGYPFANSIQAIDRPEINFRVRMFTCVLVIGASIWVAPIWGLEGIAFLQVIAAMVSFGIRVTVFRVLFSETAIRTHDPASGVVS